MSDVNKHFALRRGLVMGGIREHQFISDCFFKIPRASIEACLSATTADPQAVCILSRRTFQPIFMVFPEPLRFSSL